MSEYLNLLQPRVSKVGDGTFPIFGETDATPKLIDESDWEDFSFDDLAWHIIDQGNQGSCCACASIGALMLCREVAGLPRVVLSQGSLYGRINGGRDAGAAIDSGLRELAARGVCDEKTVPARNWQRNLQPDGWEENAENYMAVEAFDCPTYKHAVSAVHARFPVVFGCRWNGGGGHAIFMTGHRKSGKVPIVNSHSRRYGRDGRGELPRSQVESGINGFGAWALRVPTLS